MVADRDRKVIDVDFRHQHGDLTMTTANKITVMRILLVPFFITLTLYYVKGGNEIYRYLALGCFALAAVSDGIDGFIARRFNQRSELGSILDPLADKLLLVSGIILLSFRNQGQLPSLPLWLTITVISRDVILVLGLLIIHYLGSKVVVRPHFVGKIATVLQMSCVLWALLKLNLSWLFYIALGASITTGASGLIYIFDGLKQLSTNPASSPTQTPDSRTDIANAAAPDGSVATKKP